MAIGDLYLRILEDVRAQFEAYAEKCRADLFVVLQPIDETFHRGLMAQKMLIPDLFLNYDWVMFCDLDVFINEESPSIFDEIPNNKFFGAVLDPRGSPQFINIVKKYWGYPEILEETHRSYFTDRGFVPHEGIVGSINGGVFVCSPQKCAPILKSCYLSDFEENARAGGCIRERSPSANEESLMAYAMQTADLFFPLNPKFNAQFAYEVYKEVEPSDVNSFRGWYFRILYRLDRFFAVPYLMYPMQIKKIFNRIRKQNYVVHFAGRIPFRSIVKTFQGKK